MTGRNPFDVPRVAVTLASVAFLSLVAVGIGSFLSHSNTVTAGLVSLVIVGHAALVTLSRRCPDNLILILWAVCVLIDLLLVVDLFLIQPPGLIAGLLERPGVVVGLAVGIVVLGLLTLLGLVGFFVCLALGVVRVVEDARNVIDGWQPEPDLPSMRSLSWMRRLLPPGAGAVWWREVVSTLAETPDLDQRRAFVRSYRRALHKVFWTSWALYLSSARRREVS